MLPTKLSSVILRGKFITFLSVKIFSKPLTKVDFALPFSPLIRTPPIFSLIILSNKAFLILP